MLLEGSSARVLQCCPLPTDRGAVFNSFSKQSCLQTNCSMSPYLCPARCWFGYCEILATVLFADLHWRTCLFLQKKHRQQQHRIPFDAVAMKATASFIREKITQAVWKMLWHFQVQIKHIIWQTSFAWMSFQTWIRAMEFSIVYFGRMPPFWLSLSNSVCALL